MYLDMLCVEEVDVECPFKDLDFEKLLGVRDVYMKTLMNSNYKKDIFYTREQV